VEIMVNDTLQNRLGAIRERALEEIESAKDEPMLFLVKSKYLGKKSEIAETLKGSQLFPSKKNGR